MDNAISDLGTKQGSPLFFNTGVILSGILLLLFSIGLIIKFKNDELVPKLLFVSSFFLMGVGIFPLPGSDHIFTSGVFFLSFVIFFLIFGLSYIKDETYKTMSKIALVIAIISILTPVFLLFNKGIALPEMLILLPGFSWCMIYGYYIVKTAFLQ
jgi:hypothetical membrane protein